MLKERDFKRLERDLSAAETRFNNLRVKIAANVRVQSSNMEKHRAQHKGTYKDISRKETVLKNREH